MKRLLIMALIIGVATSFWSCSENNPIIPELNQNDVLMNSVDKKFIPRLVGDMALAFDFTRAPYFWQGTVDFRRNGVYGIRFESLGPPVDDGTFTHFKENFEIFELGNIEQVYLSGPDAGVIYNKNSKTIANGEVTEANAPFEMWLGSNANFTGVGTFGTEGLPISFEGIFRVY